ncbi:MAG: RnfABCDGE type electron transport complex subunit B [Deltaproteobacteria bacterium]|nr:RnfABCDGE type electron transport complex subunit B [Deltaproteobacteria bacterium]
MDTQSILLAVGLMAALGLVLSTILAVANSKLHVYEDPRINQVDGLLPGANCGACGVPGCHAFAEKVVSGEMSPGLCTVSSEDARENIAELLGVDVGGEDKRVARLACAGGTNVARQRARYVGVETCRSANLVAGGGKGCAWGCLGLADCMVVCDFNAIVMSPEGLPVVDEDLCTACGDCVDICPKDLFSIQSVNNRLWVACANEAFGDEAENECEVACTACARCAADAPVGVVEMLRNLPRVDYSRNDETSEKAIQRCPTGAIVWLSPRRGLIKGREAKPIVRQTPLPLG